MRPLQLPDGIRPPPLMPRLVHGLLECVVVVEDFWLPRQQRLPYRVEGPQSPLQVDTLPPDGVRFLGCECFIRCEDFSFDGDGKTLVRCNIL